jgi:ketosteroid isomerase-like protein
VTALDLVRAYQDAWTRKDFGAAAEFLAEDFTHDAPGASYTSAREWLPALARFGERIGSGWRPVAAFGDDTEALLMYELFALSGEPLPLTVDYFTVRDGKITSETLVFDSRSFGAALAAST